MDDFVKAKKMYKNNPCKFYEKYSEFYQLRKDEENYKEIFLFETDERNCSIFINKKSGEIEFLDELCFDQDEEIVNDSSQIKSIEDLIWYSWNLDEFKIKNYKDLEHVFYMTDTVSYLEEGEESIDIYFKEINKELKKLGFNPLAKNKEKERDI